MPPQTSLAGNQQAGLDPQAVALAKAIRQTESGGDAKARGKSGEYGAYQFTQPTWAKYSREAGLNKPLEQTSLEEQNQVAYHMIKKWKDTGRNPGQIASMWNAGEGEPDAYKGTFSNGVPAKGVNKWGAKYDVPAYATSVAQAYQTLKQGGIVNADPNNPSSVAATQPQDENKEGFLKSVFRGITQPVVTMLARPLQLGAELLGASPEQVNEASSKVPFYGEGNRLDVPMNAQDVVKDVGRGLETVALGMPVKGFSSAVKMGATAGYGSGLEQTGDFAQALPQAALGAGLGAVGGTIASTLTKLPKRLVGDVFDNLDDAGIQHVLNTKKLGTLPSIARQNEKAISTMGSKIDDLLMNTTEKGGGNFAVRHTLNQFPEFAGKEVAMATKIKRLIPAGYDVGLKSSGWERATIVKYIDKIFNGTATLYEKNKVRSAIDSATKGGYSKLARSLNPSAGHDLAMTFASALRNEVQQSVPATASIFEQLAQEMTLQNALKQLAKHKPGAILKWSDLLPLIGGHTLMGPIGAGVGLLAGRAAQTPSAQLLGARALQATGKAVNPVVGRAGLISTVK